MDDGDSVARSAEKADAPPGDDAGSTPLPETVRISSVMRAPCVCFEICTLFRLLSRDCKPVSCGLVRDLAIRAWECKHLARRRGIEVLGMGMSGIGTLGCMLEAGGH
jgi:hypothetical protein